MLNAQSHYRWILLQFPSILFTEAHKAQIALALVTDISHLSMTNIPLMTLIDNYDKKNQFFKVIIETKQLVALNLSPISKREHEIILLMAKGLNTPQIAEQLFISYNTVENHKKNLRTKTNTKTSAELMSYVWSNHLI